MNKRHIFIVLVFVIFFVPLFVSTKGLYDVDVMQNIASNITYSIKTLKNIDRNESPDLPEYILIPSINVSAKIQILGVTAKGEMDVPNNIVDAGWFGLGSRPGEKGSAVIAGHLNGINGEKGVFADLDKLKLGDKIFIKDTKGTLVSFVIKNIQNYDPGYADEVFSANDGTYLNLVTCNGIWNTNKNSFSKRLVVFAKKSVE